MNDSFRPDLSLLSARLAQNTARINRVLDALSVRIDEMVAHADRSDWQQVRELSETVAGVSEAHGMHTLGERARQVGKAATRTDDVCDVKRSLIRLIGAYGRARSQIGPKR